jgi:hypothetical protein
MRKVEWNRKTVSVVLLAVVLPISLVVVLQLTDRGIVIAENTTLDPVEWTFQRPNEPVDILDKLNTTYASDGFSADMYVLIIRYENNSMFIGDYDYLRISIAINAATSNPNSYIESVYVVVQKDNESALGWVRLQLHLENLSLVASADAARWRTKAYIKLAGANHTGSVYTKATAEWSLITSNTQSHQMETAYEIVYYNGTAYNKVVQPFQLNIIGAEGE